MKFIVWSKGDLEGGISSFEATVDIPDWQYVDGHHKVETLENMRQAFSNIFGDRAYAAQEEDLK